MSKRLDICPTESLPNPEQHGPFASAEGHAAGLPKRGPLPAWQAVPGRPDDPCQLQSAGRTPGPSLLDFSDPASNGEIGGGCIGSRSRTGSGQANQIDRTIGFGPPITLT